MKVGELVSKREKPTIKLYSKDLPSIKDMDVDDTCELRIKVKVQSKYREDYMEGKPLCITFEVQKVSRDE